MVDPGTVVEQLLLLPLGQAAGDDHAADLALLASARSISSIAANDSSRARSMNPQVLTTTKSAPVGSWHQLVAVQLQQTQHPLAVDEVLGTAEADEGVGAFG